MFFVSKYDTFNLCRRTSSAHLIQTIRTSQSSKRSHGSAGSSPATSPSNHDDGSGTFAG